METYREEQYFNQVWVRLLVGGLALLAWVFLFVQPVFGNDVGEDPAPDWLVIVLFFVFGIAFPAWFFLLHLVTIVDDGGVDARFRPALGSASFAFDEIVSFEPVEYHPVKEFGGWGVRWGKNRSRALNVSGNLGVRIVNGEGRMFLIGSQTPDQLAAAIRFHKQGRR